MWGQIREETDRLAINKELRNREVGGKGVEWRERCFVLFRTGLNAGGVGP